MAVLDMVLRLPVFLVYLCSLLWSALPPIILSVPTVSIGIKIPKSIGIKFPTLVKWFSFR